MTALRPIPSPLMLVACADGRTAALCPVCRYLSRPTTATRARLAARSHACSGEHRMALVAARWRAKV